MMMIIVEEKPRKENKSIGSFPFINFISFPLKDEWSLDSKKNTLKDNFRLYENDHEYIEMPKWNHYEFFFVLPFVCLVHNIYSCTCNQLKQQ